VLAGTLAAATLGIAAALVVRVRRTSRPRR
jgi:hypothetical protein